LPKDGTHTAELKRPGQATRWMVLGWIWLTSMDTYLGSWRHLDMLLAHSASFWIEYPSPLLVNLLVRLPR
jgi:hypothetical protein